MQKVAHEIWQLLSHSSHDRSLTRALSFILSGAILLIYTGWGQYWNDASKYIGIETGKGKNATKIEIDDLLDPAQKESGLHYPGLDESAGEIQRGVFKIFIWR